MLIVFSSIRCDAQSKHDFEHIMSKFMKFYNNGQKDSLQSLLSTKIDRSERNMFNKPELLQEMKKETGVLRSYKYILTDSSDVDANGRLMSLFIINCSKKVNNQKAFAFNISLDQDNKIYNWRFITTSHRNDSLIKLTLSQHP